MCPAIHQPVVAAGVEEEFHIVDLATGRLTGQAGRLMEQLPARSFSSELQRSVLEDKGTSPPIPRLTSWPSGACADCPERRRPLTQPSPHGRHARTKEVS